MVLIICSQERGITNALRKENTDMKVSKSTADCAAYNKLNADAIAVGILEAVEPDERTLQQEQREEAQRKAGLQIAASKLAVLQMLDPNVTKEGDSVCGVSVRIEEVRSGYSYSSGNSKGWKLHIGGRWSNNKRWMAIGDGATLGLNTKQLAKAKTILAEVKSLEDKRNAASQAVTSDKMRTEAFVKLNPDFCKLVGESYFCSGESYKVPGGGVRYTKAFIALPDGKVKIGYEVFTVAQWTEIKNLEAAQTAALKQLKASFAK